MDERLQKALEFSNFNLTINNQKKNIKNRVEQLRIVHYAGGVFRAGEDTISFVKTLIDLGHTESVLVDSKENPVKINKLQELLDELLSAYFSATNEFAAHYDKIKKARNIKSIMDW